MKNKLLVAFLLAAVMAVPLAGCEAVGGGEVTLEVLNPVGVNVIEPVTPAPRPDTLDGNRIVMTWNQKGNGWMCREAVQKEMEKHITGADYVYFDFRTHAHADLEEIQAIVDLNPDAVITSWNA